MRKKITTSTQPHYAIIKGMRKITKDHKFNQNSKTESHNIKWAHANNHRKSVNNVLTGVLRTPNRSLTNPMTGPAWRFIISSCICEGSILEISEEGKEGSGFLPHSFHASSSSSSNTSSKSSVMWTLRFPPRTKREIEDAKRRRRRRVGRGLRVMRKMMK